MNLSEYFALRKARKELDAICLAARSMRNMRGDLLSAEELAEVDSAIAAAKAARPGAKRDVDSAVERLNALIDRHGGGRRNALLDNFEVLLVAISVAMAFRCYFFQPFKIPTGSMQPTLYGISSVDATQEFWDKPPFKALAWLVTGAWYSEVRAERDGVVVHLFMNQSKPGYNAISVAGKLCFVPSDVITTLGDKGRLNVRPLPPHTPNLTKNREPILGTVRAGDVVWSGRVISGDHVFVNRLTWNFRPPRRGDVMVFSTRGIKGLPQGTHYIKRMTGLPGETVSIDAPRLIVDGSEVAEPETIAHICRREKFAPWAPNYVYAGYQTIGGQPADTPRALRQSTDKVVLGADEYYALGDNTTNSRDSRYWGPVPARNLLGPGCIVYWPFSSPRWGGIR